MTIIHVDFKDKATRYFESTPKPDGALLCRHRTVEVDDHLREVSCAKCGKIIDAFDYLSGLAWDEIKLFEQMKQLKIEEAELIKRVEALRHEERNVKTRLKTAYKKQSTPRPPSPVLEKKDKQSCIDEIKQKLKP